MSLSRLASKIYHPQVCVLLLEGPNSLLFFLSVATQTVFPHHSCTLQKSITYKATKNSEFKPNEPRANEQSATFESKK